MFSGRVYLSWGEGVFLHGSVSGSVWGECDGVGSVVVVVLFGGWVRGNMLAVSGFRGVGLARMVL